MKKKIIIFLGLIIAFFLFLNFNNEKIFSDLKGNILTYQNGNIKLNLYNALEEAGNIKLHYKDIYKLEIDVDLSNYPEGDKVLKILLNEGLRYSSLPVLEVSDSTYQTEISKTNTLYNAISEVDTSNIKVEDNYKDISNKVFPNSIYGEIYYHIKEDISHVTLNLNITSDLFRYYGEHIIENALNIEVLYDDKVINSMAKNIKLFDKDTNKTYIDMQSNLIGSYPYNKTIKASDGINTMYGNCLYLYNRFQENNLNTVGMPKFRKIIYELYYPVGTSFETLINNVGVEFDNIIKYEDITLDELYNSETYSLEKINVIDYKDENKIVVVTSDNTFDGKHVSIKYKVNDLSEFEDLDNSGDYVTSSTLNNGFVEITFYDGNVRTIDITGKQLNLQIWYPYGIPNLVEFNQTYAGEKSNNAYDDNNDETFIFGPYFAIENVTPGDKTNQVLEYQIDENYQAVGVTFPRTYRLFSVSNIKYQIYGTCLGCGNPDENGWYSYNGKLDSTIFNKKTIGDTSSTYYFKAVKVTVEKYEENYFSASGAARGEVNGVVYGNLKS